MLTAEKRKLESDICERDAKISKLTNSASYWRKRLKNLVKRMTKDQRQKSCLKNKNKAFSEYSERSRRRIKKCIEI